MTITRPHVCEENLAGAAPDDEGNITVTIHAGLAIAQRSLAPEEARDLATELMEAADTADAYRAEQAGAGR